jgi:protoporphyrin/coproporphyrin ferrochelatase
MASLDRLAVVLFNLGGPDCPAAVEPFLFNLFSDPAIIRLPGPLRWLIAKIISRRRAPVARQIYAHLGGGSPLLANTEAQASALQTALADAAKEVRVFIAMRYWHPFSAETAKAVMEFAPDRVLLLPLYPQYSTTTAASSAAAWRQAAASVGLKAPSQLICCYPAEPGFIEALVQLTETALVEAASRAPNAKVRLIFTAHGLPVKIVKAGDPYVEHVSATCDGVMARLQSEPKEWELGFQSRVGPVEWIGPSTEELIVDAAAENRAIVVLPVAFVSEHSETLVELDIDYRKLAEARGAPAFIRVPTVATHPAFIAGLERIVRQALSDGRPAVSFGSCPAESRSCPCRASNRGAQA